MGKRRRKKIGGSVIGFYTDSRGRKRPITGNTGKLPTSLEFYKIYEPPTRKFDTESKKIVDSVVMGMLEGALVHGISAAFPVVAPLLVPMYDLYTYGKFGASLLELYNDLSNSQSSEIKFALRKMSDPYGEIVSQPVADIVAKHLVNLAIENGLIRSVAEKTRVGENVYSAMLEGSISNGISSGVGSLTAFAVGASVGV